MRTYAIALTVLLTGCGDPKVADEQECDNAAAEFERAYDAFDRSCTVDDDCRWYQDLASCNCPGFGNKDADASEVEAARAAENAACPVGAGSSRDVQACQNNYVCRYSAGGIDGASHTLSCDAGRCVATPTE